MAGYGQARRGTRLLEHADARRHAAALTAARAGPRRGRDQHAARRDVGAGQPAQAAAPDRLGRAHPVGADRRQVRDGHRDRQARGGGSVGTAARAARADRHAAPGAGRPGHRRASQARRRPAHTCPGRRRGPQGAGFRRRQGGHRHHRDRTACWQGRGGAAGGRDPAGRGAQGSGDRVRLPALRRRRRGACLGAALPRRRTWPS